MVRLVKALWVRGGGALTAVWLDISASIVQFIYSVVNNIFHPFYPFLSEEQVQ